MLNILRAVWNENEGQDVAEYAMMLAVILLIVVGVVSQIGTNAQAIFSTTASKLTTT